MRADSSIESTYWLLDEAMLGRVRVVANCMGRVYHEVLRAEDVFVARELDSSRKGVLPHGSSWQMIVLISTKLT
jgi:hypothetical protein